MAAPSFWSFTMKRDLIFSILAISIYIIGGLMTFGGVATIILLRGRDFMGAGDAYGIGYLLVCVGLVLTVLGVLIMRIVRNRFRA